jgi:hypothetical protein
MDEWEETKLDEWTAAFFSHKEELNYDICREMNGTGKYYVTEIRQTQENVSSHRKTKTTNQPNRQDGTKETICYLEGGNQQWELEGRTQRVMRDTHDRSTLCPCRKLS